MSILIVGHKFIKSISFVSSVSMIMLWGNPASAVPYLLDPTEMMKFESNAIDSSGISGTNPSEPQLNNNGSPNLFNPNNNNPSFSFPFVSNQNSQNQSNNGTSDNGDNSGTETSGNNERGTSTASGSGDTSTNSSTMTTNPQDSDINTLITVANMLDPVDPGDPNESGPTDTECEDSDDCTTVCDNPNNSDDCTSVKIPEPTSVLAIGMIGLFGLLTKSNQRFL